MKKQGSMQVWVHVIVKFKYIPILMWVIVSYGPENKYDNTPRCFLGLMCYMRLAVGESFSRRRGNAASVSLSSHSVSGNDAKLRAVF